MSLKSLIPAAGAYLGVRLAEGVAGSSGALIKAVAGIAGAYGGLWLSAKVGK